MIHALKQEPHYFDAVLSGLKTFEVRFADRDYRVGDLLALNEYNSQTKEYTGRSIIVEICYVLKYEAIYKDGYLVLGFKPYAQQFAYDERVVVPLATEEYKTERTYDLLAEKFVKNSLN